MNPKTTWSAKKLKKAANKHYIACVHLQKHLENGCKNEMEIANTLFYLSGYILECIFKSALLYANHNKSDLTLDELNRLELKTHDIKILWQRVTEKVKIDYSKLKWTPLTYKWNSEIRYEPDKNDFNNKALVLSHFKETVIPIFTKIYNYY